MNAGDKLKRIRMRKYRVEFDWTDKDSSKEVVGPHFLNHYHMAMELVSAVARRLTANPSAISSCTILRKLLQDHRIKLVMASSKRREQIIRSLERVISRIEHRTPIDC